MLALIVLNTYAKLPKTISLGKPQKNKMVFFTDKSSHFSIQRPYKQLKRSMSLRR